MHHNRSRKPFILVFVTVCLSNFSTAFAGKGPHSGVGLSGVNRPNFEKLNNWKSDAAKKDSLKFDENGLTKADLRHKFENSMPQSANDLKRHPIKVEAIKYLGTGKGGDSSGGGNSMVCFKNPSIAQKLKAEDKFKPVAIPDDLLSQITSIEILDLIYENIDASGAPLFFRRIEPPAKLYRPSTDNLNQLERAYFYYISRFENSYPQFYDLLIEAQNDLPVSELQIANRSLHQVNDWARYFHIPENCVISTMFQQNSPTSPGWKVDGRLFFHPTHSYFSQIAAVLHERYFWLGRKYSQNIDATHVYRVVKNTLDSRIDYREMRYSFITLFINNSEVYSQVYNFESAARVWLADLWKRMVEHLESRGEKLQFGKPDGWKKLKSLYLNSYQSELMNQGNLSLERRKELDRSILRFLNGPSQFRFLFFFDTSDVLFPAPLGKW